MRNSLIPGSASLSATCSNSRLAFNLILLHYDKHVHLLSVIDIILLTSYPIYVMIKIDVPVASADRYMSSLLPGCDFLHPYSNHNTPAEKFKIRIKYY